MAAAGAPVAGRRHPDARTALQIERPGGDLDRVADTGGDAQDLARRTRSITSAGIQGAPSRAVICDGAQVRRLHPLEGRDVAGKAGSSAAARLAMASLLRTGPDR